MSYERKFAILGAELYSERSPNPGETIAALEHELDLQLPDEYRDFLFKYRAAIFFGEGAIYRPLELSPIADAEGHQDVNPLYGPVDGQFGLLDVNRQLRDQVPPHVLAIGEAGFGDAVCLAIVGPQRGQIYYWNHEDPDELRIYLIARSFAAFIDALQPEPGFSDPISPMKGT